MNPSAVCNECCGIELPHFRADQQRFVGQQWAYELGTLDAGQNWRDIARWNQIENANLIEVGQVLRVRPEAAASRAAARPVDRSADR